MPEKDNLSPWALLYREGNGDLANYWPEGVWVVTERLTVPGGWIVRTLIEGGDAPYQISTVFVPCSKCALPQAPEIGRITHRMHWNDLMPAEEE